MKLKKYRSSFLCSFVGQSEVLSSCQKFLEKLKYRTNIFKSADSLFEQVNEDPPHFVCYSISHFNQATFSSWLERFAEELPETKLIILVEDEFKKSAIRNFHQSVYAVFSLSEVTPEGLLREIDHATENLVYLYLNEQLSDRVQQLEEGVLSSDQKQEDQSLILSDNLDTSNNKKDCFSPYIELQESLFTQLSTTKSIEAFLTHLEPQLQDAAGALYFKFNSPRRTLVASYGLGIDPALIEGIGLNFEKVDPEFKRSEIKQIHKRESFNGLLREVFQVSEYSIRYLTLGDEVVGAFVHWGTPENTPEHEFIEKSFTLLSKHCQHLDSEERLHNVELTDETESALKKHKFFQRMNAEVARARRISLPLSFVLLSIDGFRDIENGCDSADLRMFLKSLAQIVFKHSRVNDILGRISRSEFGLLLPHTELKGGVVKAERLRRMIESANFRKVLQSDEPVTLSLSVSEYPSNCRDADELFQSADQALFDQESHQPANNRVVVAKPPEGFIADFIVADVNDSRLLR